MAQIDSQSISINGRTYQVFKLPPLTAQDVLIDLAQALAPAASELTKILDGQKDIATLERQIDPGAAIGKIAMGLTKEKMRDLVSVMQNVTHCDGKELGPVFDAVFSGDLPAMYQWLWFALRVQFGNFSGLVNSVLTRAASAGEQVDRSRGT